MLWCSKRVVGAASAAAIQVITTLHIGVGSCSCSCFCHCLLHWCSKVQVWVHKNWLRTGPTWTMASLAFRHMLDRSLYISHYDNNMYAGRSAYQAAELEEKQKRGCGPPPDHIVYHCVAYGMPMTSVDVDRLIKLIYDNKMNPCHWGEVFMLLQEFHGIASRIIPEYHNTAMQHVLDRRFNPYSSPKIEEGNLQMYQVPC